MSTKKTNRIKAEPVIENQFEFVGAVDAVTVLQNELNYQLAERNGAIQSVQLKYNPDIKALEKDIKQSVALCEQFARANRESLFPKSAKSASSLLARFGFRAGQPTLKPLSRLTWTKVVDRILEAGQERWLRLTYQVNKDILREKATPEEMAEIGVRVVQAESFYIEPKTEESERMKQEAV